MPRRTYDDERKKNAHISSSSKRNLLKNRIPVPPGEGRNLFGVVDETRTLEYGECFIQYSSLENANDGKKKYHVVTGQ